MAKRKTFGCGECGEMNYLTLAERVGYCRMRSNVNVARGSTRSRRGGEEGCLGGHRPMGNDTVSHMALPDVLSRSSLTATAFYIRDQRGL